MTEYTYDRLGRRLTLKNPLNRVWATAFSEQANAVQRTVLTYPNGTQTMTRDIDPVGRLATIQYDNPATTPTVSYGYDVNGRVTRMVYDGLGRQTKTIVNYVAQGTSNPANWVFEGAVWKQSAGGTAINHGVAFDQNIISETVYDADGRLAVSRSVEGLEQRPAYDSLGRQTHSVQNFVNKSPVYEPIATWIWESGVWKDKANGASIQRGTGFDQNIIAHTVYDEQGRVLQTRDARGVLTRMVYDALGRRVKTINNFVAQSTAPETWAWNEAQQRWEGGSGVAIDFGVAKNQNLISETRYDRVGRVSQTRDVAGKVTLYLYDRVGRRVRTIANYVAQGSSDPAQWVYRAVNALWAWRQSASSDTLINFGTNFDQNHLSDSVFNQAGQVTSARDARGTATTFAYDRAGRRRSSTLASGTGIAVSDYTCYDKAGRVLRQIQSYMPEGGVSPDELVLNSGNRWWQFAPIAHGNHNDENIISELFYDRASRTVRRVNAEGNAHETTYLKDGLTSRSTDPTGIHTVYRYDGLNRRYVVVANYVAQGSSDPANWVFEGAVWKQSAGGTAIGHGTNNDQNIIVRLTYDLAGRVSKMQEPRGNMTEYTYDRLGRRLTLKNPLNRVWATAFSEQANAVQRTVLTYPNGTQTMTRDIDPVGRLLTVQYDAPATTPTVSMSYDVRGQRTRMSEHNGSSTVRVTDYEYDQARRLKAVKTDLDGNGTVDETLAYGYDVGGKRTTLTMPGGLQVVYEYDVLGQLSAMTDWGNSRHIFGFDRLGRQVFSRRPNALTTQMRYDRASRLKSVRHAKDSRLLAQFEYAVDARGNRTQATELVRGVSASNSARTLPYDHASITYIGTWANSAPFKVLAGWEGRMAVTVYANQITLTYGTGPDHSMFDVYIGGTLWQSYDGYASTTGETSVTINLATSERVLLEIRNRPEKNRLSSGYKLRFKQVVSNVDLTMREINYTYDALSRLIFADADTGTDYAYSYDLAGNLINNNGVNRVYNGANQLVQNGATTLTYDQSGNLIFDGANTHTWDSANRLVQAVSGANTYQFAYNGDGNRLSQSVNSVLTKYMLDTQAGLALVLGETTGANTTVISSSLPSSRQHPPLCHINECIGAGVDGAGRHHKQMKQDKAHFVGYP
jgi:YD repeat-containing protein